MTLLPKVKLKTLVSFPASVRGGTGINVTQENGVYTFDIDYSQIAPAPVIPPGQEDTTYIVVWDSINNTFTTMSLPDAAAVTGIPQNSQSANYTTVADDAQKHLLHPSADTTARTFTIAANAAVAYPIGTVITFVNQNAAGVLTIAVTSDTMRLAGAGTTGNRTLAANGVCTALKITTTEWIISGTGLT
jgi:hypothetical protein